MRIACVQTHVAFNDPAANASAAIAELGRLCDLDVDLVVFPEAYLTGYCVDSLVGATKVAIIRDDPAIGQLQAECERLDMLAVVGFAEDAGDTLYNSAALFEPGAGVRFYRKTHLPELGYDNFATPGDELPVFDTRHGVVGILICFDQRFPEAARVLALRGAELIVLPTNWPKGATVSAQHLSIARAAENKVYFATCNRVGTEGGYDFIGLSKIVDPYGVVLAEAGAEAETIIANVSLSVSRNKRTVVQPYGYAIEVMSARNPSLYGVVTSESDSTEPL